MKQTIMLAEPMIAPLWMIVAERDGEFHLSSNISSFPVLVVFLIPPVPREMKTVMLTTKKDSAECRNQIPKEWQVVTTADSPLLLLDALMICSDRCFCALLACHVIYTSNFSAVPSLLFKGHQNRIQRSTRSTSHVVTVKVGRSTPFCPSAVIRQQKSSKMA